MPVHAAFLAFDLPALSARAKELEGLTSAPDFWSREGNQDVLKELSSVNGRLSEWEKVASELDDLEVLKKMPAFLQERFLMVCILRFGYLSQRTEELSGSISRVISWGGSG